MVEFQLFDRPVSVRSSSPCPLPDGLIGFFLAVEDGRDGQLGRLRVSR